ncbi:hypothetical protein HS041_03250 [Planomonospora sp. ID67723]|uniref:CPCC family cysteine-rich protein n=1 Tax=Planomonospora sp. ID67723 TaxID=2738134 RepID=UPI0018C3E8A3|nr:hypothetical protein [Planomonospora sp. ID67723]
MFPAFHQTRRGSPVCFWEDEHDTDEVRGGPNDELSLARGRRNSARFGASSKRSITKVRDLLPHEHPIK